MSNTATPRTLELTEEDLKPRFDYASFEDGEYVGTLVDVEDIEANKTDNYGWKWFFQVEGLNFGIVTWLKGGGLWKVNEVLNAFGSSLEEGTSRIDPTRFVGMEATVIIATDPSSDQGYKNVARVLPIAEKPIFTEEETAAFIDEPSEDGLTEL